MANVIVKSFTIQGTVETPAKLYSRSDRRWSNFQNTYAVWPTSGNESASYTIRRFFTAPYTGTYYFRSTVDNGGTVYVDGNVVGGTASYNQTPSPVGVSLTAGSHTLQFDVSNGGDVAGFACTISNSSDAVIWDTRTYANANTVAGRYALTMPYRASITVHAWGAGGGGGGMDAGSYGGVGSDGLYNTHTFAVEKGQLVEVDIGYHGSGGSSNSGGAPGGAGGSSRTYIGGDAAKSLNGGSGTAAGPAPYSGGGGGGGGASAVLVDNVPVLVAGGGGGGGGGGNDGNGPYERRDAAITNNATGAAGTDFRGENGQSKGGDGGGAGGGGGGYPGGQGGPVAGGDASGFAGQCGGNFPIYAASTGAGTKYYQAGFAGGGQRGGGNGQPGRVVLEITPLSLATVKVSGAWRSITEGFIKVSGEWRPIDEIYIKVRGRWRKVQSAGDRTLSNFESDTAYYGAVGRGFS